MEDHNIFETAHGTKLAYYYQQGNAGVTVVFCGGYMSDMTGTKASCLETNCLWKGVSYLRFDYSGHGESDGAFRDGTISTWAQDAIEIIKHVTEGPVIIVGSSMGGWISLLAALALPERIVALIGLAPAPDFTERLVNEDLTDAQRQKMAQDGFIELPSDYGDDPYIFTQKLVDDGQKNLLLKGPIDLNIPVRLIHGMADRDVPYETSQKIASLITGKDVEVCLIKDGDHRLSSAKDIRRLNATLANVIAHIMDEKI